MSLWITNGGGGVFKDIWSASTYATNGLYVSNTQTPGRIYAMSVEHHVRNEVHFKNVSNWQVYALQLEEESRESLDCQQIELQNCSDILFANLYLFGLFESILLFLMPCVPGIVEILSSIMYTTLLRCVLRRICYVMI